MNHVNWNRQLGLAIALFSLGTTAYWLEYKHRPEKEASEENSKRIFQIKEKPVHSISLIKASQKFVFSCGDVSSKLCKPEDHSHWELQEPSKLKADDSNANALLSTLSTLSSNEMIDLKDEAPEKRTSLLKEYGLDPESREKLDRQVVLKTETEETTLYLGNTHPIGESIFALKKIGGQLNENRIYLVPSFFKVNFDHDLTYWRDKKLFPWGAHDVASFTLKGSQSEFSATKKENQWILRELNPRKSAPASDASISDLSMMSGDLETIDHWMNSLSVLSAKNFAADLKTDEKAKSLLKGLSPRLTLTLEKEKGSAKDVPAPLTLQFFVPKESDLSKSKSADELKSKPKPSKIYVIVSQLDPLFEIDGSSLSRFDKNIKDFRLTKLITSMDRFSAKRLEFTGAPFGKEPKTMTQDKGKWSHDKAQDLLEKFSGNRIKEYLEGSKIPSGEKEGVTVTLSNEKSEVLKKLLFWKKDGKLYAKDLQSKRQEAFLMDSQIQEALPWSTDFFKVPEPQSSPSPAGPSQTTQPAPGHP